MTLKQVRDSLDSAWSDCTVIRRDGKIVVRQFTEVSLAKFTANMLAGTMSRKLGVPTTPNVFEGRKNHYVAYWAEAILEEQP